MVDKIAASKSRERNANNIESSFFVSAARSRVVSYSEIYSFRESSTLLPSEAAAANRIDFGVEV
jgi:hypothetical protein